MYNTKSSWWYKIIVIMRSTLLREYIIVSQFCFEFKWGQWHGYVYLNKNKNELLERELRKERTTQNDSRAFIPSVLHGERQLYNSTWSSYHFWKCHHFAWKYLSSYHGIQVICLHEMLINCDFIVAIKTYEQENIIEE